MYYLFHVFVKCGQFVLTGCLAWPGYVLTLDGPGCHCRWLSWASALLLNHHDFTKQWRSEVRVHRLTQNSHFPRLSGNEVYFEATLAHFSSVGALWGALPLTRQQCKMAPIDFLSLYSERPDPLGALSKIVKRPPSHVLLLESAKWLAPL